MSRSKKISLLLTTLVATISFSTNCFAMEKNNSKQDSNEKNITIKIINTFKNEDDIKLLEKKRNPEKKAINISKQEDEVKPENIKEKTSKSNNKLIKPILVGFNDFKNQDPTNNKNNIITNTLASKQKSELKSKIIDKETFKSNNKSIKPILVGFNNFKNQNPTNNNIIPNTLASKQKSGLKPKIIKEETSKSKNSNDNNKLKKPIFMESINTANQNPTNNNSNTNTLTSKQKTIEEENIITKKLIYLKNELQIKIKCLEISKEKLNQNIFNKSKDVLKNQLKEFEETLNYIKKSNNKFNNTMNSEINEKIKQELDKPVNKKLIEEIYEIFKNFEKTYSDFMDKGFEKIDVNDIKNDIEDKSNNPKTNKFVIEKNYELKTLTKEKYKNNILMELFTNHLKKQYTNFVNSYLQRINKNNEDYLKDNLVIKRNIDKDTIDSLRKKYNIFVYFPQSSIPNITNFFGPICRILKSNTKEILKSAAASTIKELRWAKRLNIRLGFNDKKFQEEFQNQVDYILTEEDYDEIYNELNNISINDECYNIFTDFENSLTKINFGQINEQNICSKFESLSIKDLYGKSH